AADLGGDELRGHPGDREALFLLARASARMGRDESAEAIYNRLGTKGLGAEDYLVIAAGLHRQGELGAAFRVLEQGHRVDPNHADILHDLARFCAWKEQMARAVDLAER